MNSDFIRGLIDVFIPRVAKLFDSFKVSNPVVALAIVSTLVGVQVFVESCTFEFCTQEWFNYINYTLMGLLGLIGSRTSRYLPEDKKKDLTVMDIND